VAEKALCWCEGRRKRSSLFISAAGYANQHGFMFVATWLYGSLQA
jgi:hypothetical protein